MSRSFPPVLEALLRASDEESCEEAWAAFVREYSRLVMHVAQSFGGSHDAVMNRYTYALEGLRKDDFQRLRGYGGDRRGKFTTWLTVVVRRLCLDEARTRYGRPRGGSTEAHERRRRLADLVSVDLDPELLPAYGPGPEAAAVANDLKDRLDAAIGELEPGERLMLRLRFQDEVAVKEIARIFSYPNVFHVYRRLNGILEQLRVTLQDSGIEDPLA